MLIIKVYATKRADGLKVPEGSEPNMIIEQIDEIQIQNVRRRDEDMWEYEIKKPLSTPGKILHFRAQGYRPLLKKVLGLLIGHKPGGITEEDKE